MFSWMFRVRVCVAVVCLFGAVASSLAQVAAPSGKIRALVERNTIAIEVFDPGADQRVAIGSGFVIGESAGTMTFATAEHVVHEYRKAEAGGEELQIRAWQDSPTDWFEIELSPRLVHEEHGPLDFAVLSADADGARRYINPAPEAMLLAPMPTRDSERVFYFGWDSVSNSATSPINVASRPSS